MPFTPSLSVLMHIPDGFLSVLVSLLFLAISVIVIGVALKKTAQTLAERQVPFMGVLAAALFAAQMLNFTVLGGTSGHLLGAALTVILIGPWPAVLVMTSVVSVQALFFQDGGILALGANIFNMAIVGVFVAYAVYTLLSRLFKDRRAGLFVSGFAAGWSSVFIASLSAALQLSISGTSPANIAVPAMASIHALIGIGEGLITFAALSFIFAARKDLLHAGRVSPAGNKGVFAGGLSIALILATLSPLASTHPDGLEWVAQQNGFLQTAKHTLSTIMPHYVFPGISNPAVSTISAAMIGVVIVLAVVLGITALEKHTSSKKKSQG